MAKFNFNLVDLELSSAQVNDVFLYENSKCVGLNKDKYPKIICDELLRQLEISTNIKWGNDYLRTSIIIDLYCAAKECERKFKIKIKKSQIKINEAQKLQISSTLESCLHSEKFIRQLRGEERKNVAMLAKSSSVNQVRMAAIENANKDLLLRGNLQKIHPKPVIRKAISEQNCESDKSKDHLYDLFLRANDFKYVHSVEYKLERFCITTLSSNQIKIFAMYIRNCEKSNEVSRMCFDATGGICKSPAEIIKKIFHHAIIIAMKANKIDTTNSLINVGELISALHTTHQQEIFLTRFIQMARAELKQEGIFLFFSRLFLECSVQRHMEQIIF